MKYSIIFVLALLPGLSYAQKNIVAQFNGWYMYFGNHAVTDKISLHTEYQWRRADWIVNWQQSLLRLGVDYKIQDNTILTAGYGHIVTWPYGEQPVPEKFTEHRLWEQLVLLQRLQRVYVNHRYRLEQRWIDGKAFGEPGTVYRNRIRYRLLANVPLTRKEMGPGVLFASVYDEIFIQFGPNFDRNYLDQNRLYGALGYQFNRNGNVQLGYMQQFIVKGDGLYAERNYTLQVGVTYNTDFRRGK